MDRSSDEAYIKSIFGDKFTEAEYDLILDFYYRHMESKGIFALSSLTRLCSGFKG